MITRQDKLSILITFVMGFVTGFYFFLTGFNFDLSINADSDKYNDFSIEAEAYGECSVKGCMSFQVLANGEYRLLTFDDEIGEVTKEGVLSWGLKNELIRNLDEKSLSAQSKRRIIQNCDSKEGGIDYNFKITRDSEDYILDTCRTTIEYNSRGWSSLEKLWNYFETL